MAEESRTVSTTVQVPFSGTVNLTAHIGGVEIPVLSGMTIDEIRVALWEAHAAAHQNGKRQPLTV